MMRCRSSAILPFYIADTPTLQACDRQVRKARIVLQ